MAFVENWSPKIGDKVITTKKLENSAGYMETGTIVTITNISDRGYDLTDDKGNKVTECGWSCIKQIPMNTINIPRTIYDELCKTITNFKNAPEDDHDENWLSDGEWLDIFYDLCVKIKNSIN